MAVQRDNLVDLTPGRLDFYVVAGDVLDGSVVEFEFTDDEGNALDLTGYSFDAKIEQGDESVDWNLSITDAANGKAEPEVDTSGLSGKYAHYVALIDASGDERTYVRGTVRVEEQ